MIRKSRTTRDAYGNVSSGFTQVLLYGGRQGSTIWIDYREFGSNVARPAFSQRTAHDLSQGNIIELRGTRLKVAKADAKGIRFTVLAIDLQTRKDYGKTPAPE
ncbi:MAG: hypothetical protein O7B23_02295 [Deltaproteobacteria bacterium]|nr:hypothetical protein [Deltaproteobacteria bacterium]